MKKWTIPEEKQIELQEATSYQFELVLYFLLKWSIFFYSSYQIISSEIFNFFAAGGCLDKTEDRIQLTFFEGLWYLSG